MKHHALYIVLNTLLLIFRSEYDYDDKLSSALSLCIKKLTPKLQGYYKDLAIFAEDVNITPTVLEVLWDLDEVNIHRVMVQLEKKSLVMSFFNKALGVYVYGIHQLFVVKLREMLPNSKKLELHRKLISACKNVIHNTNAKLLGTDNYLLQYFGYHLQQSNMVEKFEVYFDLNFILAKIRAAGCADILRDFQIYREYITKNVSMLYVYLDKIYLTSQCI